jgi:hypothetical protein
MEDLILHRLGEIEYILKKSERGDYEGGERLHSMVVLTTAKETKKRSFEWCRILLTGGAFMLGA